MRSYRNLINHYIFRNKGQYDIARTKFDFIKKMFSDCSQEIISAYAALYNVRYYDKNPEQEKKYINKLAGAMWEIQSMKPINNNWDMVYDAIRYVWIDKIKYDKYIVAVINDFWKFLYEENIYFTSEQYFETAASFISDMNGIIRQIAYGTLETNYDFIKSI